MKTVLTEIKNNYFVITLNRPDFKNAFDQLMIEEITDVFNSLKTDEYLLKNEKNIHAVILKGAGSVFCSGADLSWMKSMVQFNYEQNLADSEKLWDMFEAIETCPHVVITQVQGAVFGGALGLVACSDYVFAEGKTKFCFSEVKLGLAPAVISSFILNKCSESFIKPLMISAEVFSAEKALSAGLIQSIYQGELAEVEIQKRFNDNGTEAMRETKKLIKNLKTTSHKKTTTELISRLRVGAEAQDRLGRFLKK